MDPRFRDLIERLASPVQAQRDRARAALCAAGSVAVPSLLEALSHPERDTRAGACLALATLKDRRGCAPLVELSREDPDLSVCQLALRALAEMCGPGVDPEVRACLMEHLSHPDMFSRALACQGLGKLGADDNLARRALKESLDDPEAWVRSAAAEALAGGSSSADTAAPAEEPDRAGDALVLHDPAAPLLRDLQSLDANVQRRAQTGLFQLGPAVIPKLTPLMLSGPAEARRAAVEVLALLGNSEALEPLGRLLQEQELPGALRPATLHAVARVLGKEPEAASAELLDLLRQDLCAEDSYVRAGAVAAMVSAGPEPRGHALSWLLEEEDDPWVLLSGCRAISRAVTLKPLEEDLPRAMIDLLGRATDVETQVCLLEALARFAGDPAPENQAMVGPVSYFLDSEAPDVHRAAARLLAQSAPTVDRQTLARLVQMLGSDPDGQGQMVRALARLTPPGDALPVPALATLMYRADRQTAQEVTRALSAIGGLEAIQALVEAANSRRGPVVASAAQALAGMDPRGDVVAIRGADGTWRAEERHWCQCGGQLRWIERDSREQLRCPQCDAEYVQASAGKLFPAAEAPFGCCLCPGCRRKRPLIREGLSQVLVCPDSGLVHVRPFDHPRQLRLLSALPLGACTCCQEPQPLIRVDSKAVCYRTRERYRRSGDGYVRSEGETSARDDVDAINRALLMGTLGLAESGIARGSGGDDEEG